MLMKKGQENMIIICGVLVKRLYVSASHGGHVCFGREKQDISGRNAHAPSIEASERVLERHNDRNSFKDSTHLIQFTNKSRPVRRLRLTTNLMKCTSRGSARARSFSDSKASKHFPNRHMWLFGVMGIPALLTESDHLASSTIRVDSFGSQTAHWQVKVWCLFFV